MSYTRFFPILWLLCAGASALAQTAKITVKIGSVLPDLELKHGNLPVKIEDIKAEDGVSTALQAKIPVIAGFRLNAELGLNSTTSFLEYTVFPNVAQDELAYRGRYRINQYYIALIPECQFGQKWLFFNAGLGFFGNFGNKFTYGRTEPGLGYIWGDIEGSGKAYTRQNFWGYFVGTGICPSLGKNLDLLLEARLLRPLQTPDRNAITLYQNYLALNVGLTFKL